MDSEKKDKYELRNNFTQDKVRDLHPDEFEKFLHFKKMMIFFQNFEGLFEIVKENFREFWKTLFDISEYYRFHLTMDRIVVMNDVARLNMWIINTLNSFDSYEDNLAHSISQTFENDNTLKEFYEKAKNDLFDSKLEYRFCVKLRNYVQHYSMPVDKISYPSCVINDEPRELAFSVSAICFQEKLLKFKEWGKVVSKDIPLLDKEVDLAPVMQVFFNAIVDLHSRMRTKMEPLYVESKGVIEKLYSECSDHLSSQHDRNPVPTVLIRRMNGKVETEWIPYDTISVVERYREFNAKIKAYSFTTLQPKKSIDEIRNKLKEKN